MKNSVRQEVSEGKPPYSNTGAENTFGGLKALIDWCSFTLLCNDIRRVQEVLQIPSSDWVQVPRGGKGYKCQLCCGAISIFYDGAPDMGIHVNMSGQGCRQYEGRFGDVWSDLFKRVFEAKGHFSRLDGAIDDFHGFFSVEQIEEKVLRRGVRSRFKKARGMTEYDLTNDVGRGDGKTVYFGSPSSDIQIRIYDKAAQQGVAQVWVRTEVQCRDERSDALAVQIMSDLNLGKLLAGVLGNYITFIESSEDSNKARWPVSSWWSDFLGDVEKVKLTILKAVKTIDEKMEWVNRQVSTTLALIGLHLKGKGTDIYDFVSEMLIEGEKRLKPHHEALLLAG